jgi:hypothetical protein
MLQSRDILNQIRDNFDVKHFPLLYNNYVSLHTKHTVTFCRKNIQTFILCYVMNFTTLSTTTRMQITIPGRIVRF